ncbi:hypothetical protein GQX73_g9390 [Xylaria multiplex]|uniref:Enoyl-CoA hydratase domain-containing protein 3, mitochondrial n=1 Tax=Xylaria multiplex TaxID=323545 RepID=A0A7C8MJJ4_9PEZI|nr:hypothetical protein GQX73_g9390 [Xylaria multiplex]
MIDNASKRNALSVRVLDDLRRQLIGYNTPPGETAPLLLPDFNAAVLKNAFEISPKQTTRRATEDKYSWLRDAEEWEKRRHSLPKALVLRTHGPVFSSGHDLKEMDALGKEDRQMVWQMFRQCAEVMSLIRQSPIPVVGVIHGLATAAGAQLALTTDLPVAIASAQFHLPGMSIGLPCTSPSTILSRKLGQAFTYRMFALGEPVRADELPGGVVETVPDEAALEKRVLEIVNKLCNSSAQAQAMGKWAYWTQAQLGTTQTGLLENMVDSYLEAARWAARAMTIHADSADAKEGREAFLEKRGPVWRT